MDWISFTRHQFVRRYPSGNIFSAEAIATSLPRNDQTLDGGGNPSCFTILPNTFRVQRGNNSTPVFPAFYSITFPQPNHGFTITSTANLPIPLAAYNASTGQNIVVITFQAKLLANITPGCCDNKAKLLHYASQLNGPNFVSANLTPPFEDTATVCVRPVLTKSLVATSEAHTAGANVTIGEIVRYRLVTLLPEGGILNNFQVIDALPPGLKFLPDGSARIKFVSSMAPITRTAPPLPLPAFTVFGISPPSSAVLNSPPPIPLAVISGGTACGSPVSFNLGNVRNNDNDFNLEYIVIEFNALVCNQPVNQNGGTLDNTFSVSVNGNPIAQSNTVSVTIVEPKLDVQKTLTPVTAAGLSTFTVSFTNVGTSTAFNVVMNDPLPTGLVLFPTPAPTVVSSPTGCAQPSVSVSGNGVTVSSLSVPVNCTVTTSFPVYVCSHCVTNKADVTYTSLPGLGTPANTPGNTTGSTTPCTPTSDFCERQYSASAQAGINDGCPSDTGSLTVTKVITSAPPLVPPATAVFPVTVSCSPSGPNTTFNLTAANVSQTVPNIPLNSTCTVTEGPLPPPSGNPICASAQWATPTYAPGQTVTIPSTGGSQTVTVTNHYFCNTTPTCATPPANMVSWWPLNETSGTTVSDIMDGNTGQTRNSAGAVAPLGGGGPTSLTGQQVGNSMVFVNNYVEVANAANLNFGAGEFSIDAWVKSIPNGAANSLNRLQPIVDKTSLVAGLPLVRGYALFLSHPPNATTGKLGFVIDDGATPPGATTPIFHTAPVGSGWFHVAVTVARTSATSATVTLYVNGVANVPVTIAVGNTNNSSSLLIGRSRLHSLLQADFREVAIDEVEIFNRAITAAEIQQIANAGPLGKCTATISGLKFNDLNGNGVRDRGEPGLPGWTIKITDSNGNTQTTITDASGNYSFTVPAPATFTVSEIQQSGWAQTAPASGSYTVTVSANQVVNNRNFGNRRESECDLLITKEMKPTPLVNGQQASVTITVKNVGTGPCHGTTKVTEETPTGLTPISANVPGGTCVVLTGVCTFGPAIPPGASVGFSYLFWGKRSTGFNSGELCQPHKCRRCNPGE